MLSKQGRKRGAAPGLAALTAAVNAGAAKAPRLAAPAAGAPPLRGATASRAKALATLGRLVADSTAAVATPSRGGGGGDRRRAPTPAPGAGAEAAAAAASAAAPLQPRQQQGDPSAAADGSAAAATPRAPHASPAPAPRGGAAAAPMSPGCAAAQLPRLADALQRAAARMGARGGSYLYQHAEDLAGARRQLAACEAALPALPPPARRAGSARADDMALAVQLRDACASCWVRSVALACVAGTSWAHACAPTRRMRLMVAPESARSMPCARPNLPPQRAPCARRTCAACC
jgi:hypothetical protein